MERTLHAVLDQRIGRVHRLGQHKPVRVAHFISKDSIEYGMLSLLSFKKSLFSGVLDGGQDKIHMEGGRLKQFMESVDNATQTLGPTSNPTRPENGLKTAERPRSAPAKPEAPKAFASPADSAAAWDELLRAGLHFLERWGAAAGTNGEAAAAASLVERDSKTGQKYLKLPLPDPEVLNRLSGILSKLSKGQP